MKKRILLAVLCLAVLIAGLAVIKALQIRAMIDHGKKFVPPPETVTSAAVKADSWETSLHAVGTLNAVEGVTVAAELVGRVVQLSFDAGTFVQRGDILLRQDTSSEEAQLPGALAQVNLTKTILERDKKMLTQQISQADYDTAVANHEQAVAQAGTLRATIGKKTIRAPFNGQLGIRMVNLGQMLREGDPIVILQSLDPIYVDFTLPEQQFPLVRLGLPVRLTADALPDTDIRGRITAINPQIDADTRNIKVEATVVNRSGRLRPGMFVKVAIVLPGRRTVLTIPATSVLYAPYGNSVFVIEAQNNAKDRKAAGILRQQFIRLGEKRGDFVEVTSGLKDGDTVVSTGVFKLRNGQAVVVDNRIAPPFQEQPRPENE